MANSVYTLNCRGKLVTIQRPLVMGIINTTPDSFYSGSRHRAVDGVLKQAERMLAEGATMLDIGGQSTRPGAEEVGVIEEAKRVVPAINALAKEFPEAIISVDTYWGQVAMQAVEAGAHMVNDVSGGQMDAEMMSTVGLLKVPYVCMHMKGRPANMQQMAQYENVTQEVLDYFILRLEQCRQAGINDVIIDPGFGFAKTISHNFQIMQQLEIFKILDRPLLLGVSRKSTICKTLGITPEDALNGTTVLNTIGLMKGASILRVHDVKEAMEAVKLVDAMHLAID